MKAGLTDKAICSLVMTRLAWATDIEARLISNRPVQVFTANMP
jgi:hypothetical protein